MPKRQQRKRVIPKIALAKHRTPLWKLRRLVRRKKPDA